jgi:hypothetical protein
VDEIFRRHPGILARRPLRRQRRAGNSGGAIAGERATRRERARGDRQRGARPERSDEDPFAERAAAHGETEDAPVAFDADDAAENLLGRDGTIVFEGCISAQRESDGARGGPFDALDAMSERTAPRPAKDDVADVDVARIDWRDRHALSIAHGRSHAVPAGAKTKLEACGKQAVGDGAESASIQRDDLTDPSVVAVDGLNELRRSDF